MKNNGPSLYSIALIIVMLLSCKHGTHENNPVNITDSIQDSNNNMTNNTAYKSDYASVNGIRMYYEIHGSGKPLVLIHGGGSTIATAFGKILPLLACKHRVIAVELQAHGRTSDRDAPESFDQDADDVAALLHHLKINKADILGFSNGGQTAMKIAIRHPSIVNKLIAASAFYKRNGVPEQFWQGMANATFADMPQAYKDGFLALNNNQDALLNMFNRDVQRMRTFTDWNDEELRSITAPTLLIAADKDVMLPEHTVAMHRLIPNSQLAIVPGGHGSYLGEITTLVNGEWNETYVTSLLENFLSE